MISLLPRVQISPFVRFVIAGGLAALVNVLMRLLLSRFVSFELAVALAFPFGLTTAYLLSRRFVFERSEDSIPAQYVRFTIVNLFALLQVWVLSVGLANWLFPKLGFTWHAELIAHTIGVVSPVITSYYGHKLFTFRPAAHIHLSKRPRMDSNENRL
jgi:putative flippase GtrA